jgi:hypothetical protein
MLRLSPDLKGATASRCGAWQGLKWLLEAALDWPGLKKQRPAVARGLEQPLVTATALSI